MKTVHKIPLDLVYPFYNCPLAFHQGDINSRELQITLMDEGQAVTITNSISAVADATVNGVITAQDEPLTVDTTNNVLKLTLTENMLSLDGVLKIDIKITENTELLTAATLSFRIQPSVINDESRFAPVLPTIEETIAQVGVNTAAIAVLESDKEDKSNKAARITSSNIGSGTNYPSIAALAQYLGANYYDKSDIDGSTYTKSEVDNALAAKANTADVNTALAAKANTADMNTALAAKADKATTLSGYGITDAYTKDEIKAMIATAAPVKTWGDVQSVVRLGLAPDRFPVGFEFEVERGNETITFVVRGHDTIQPQSSQLTHSMILEAKNTCFKAQYDAPEALVYIDDANGLSGNANYCIPWDGSSGLSEQYLKFKTPSTPAIGQGYQIVLNTSTSPATLDVYQRRTDTTPVISGIAVTAQAYADSTILGVNSNSANNPARAVKGSNNYSQSAVRQLLYKNAAAGSVWNQTNKFDRPPAWAQTLSGFMYGLNADFVGVLSKAKIICITNNVYETTNNSGDPFTSPYEVNNEFFILSRAEVMGTGSDGTQLEGYVNATNAQRIKYDTTGNASTCVLRTPDTDSANALWYIKADGSLGKGNPSTAFGICPACIIA